MKNTAYALAREHLTGPIEALRPRPRRAFRGVRPGRAGHGHDQRAWLDAVPTNAGAAPDAFVRTDELTRTARRRGDPGPAVAIQAGFDDLTLMKTARSAFAGFPRDEYTTLPETDDRLHGHQGQRDLALRLGRRRLRRGVRRRLHDPPRRLRRAPQRVGPGHDLDDRPGRPRGPAARSRRSG